MVFSIFLLSLIFGFLSGLGLISILGVENSILRFIIYGVTGASCLFILNYFAYFLGLVKSKEK